MGTGKVEGHGGWYLFEGWMWVLWGHKPRQHGKPLVDTLQKASVFLRM